MRKSENGSEQEKQATPRGRKALIIGGIIVLVLAVLVVAYAIWERPPELAPTPAPTATPAPTPKPTAGPGDDPDKPAETPAPTELPAYKDPDALATDRESGKYTVLLVGRDHASNSTDTIIVVRLDTNAHRIDCVSIPRDTLINISWMTTPKKINAVFPGLTNSGEDAVAGLKQQIRNLIGFDVDCYSIVSIKAVEDAVDCIGGVWFDVPYDMIYEDFVQDLYIDIKQGYQLLNGSDAVKLCRFRAGYAGGDLERIGVQQAFLKETAKQILTLGNIPNISELVNILVENVDTDLTASNIAWFARQFLLCKSEDIHFHTMPYATGCVINDVSYVSVAQDDWLAMVNECLNPFVEPVTAANVNLLMSNYSGSSMWSTTGYVNGGLDSFYCLTCTVKNEGRAIYHLPGAHLDFSEPEPEGGEPAPAEGEPAPAEGEPAPAEGEPTPTEGEPAPAEGEPAPAEGGQG